MRPETINIITNSQDIGEATKQATKLYLASNEALSGDTEKEDLWTIQQSVIQEQLNIEIKGYFNFDFADITSLKFSILAARTTTPLDTTPVFAKAINNRYFEKVITTTAEGGYASYDITVSEKVLKAIQNLSSLLFNERICETIRTKLNSMSRLMYDAGLDVLNLTSIDIKVIEDQFVQLFSGNNSETFLFFVEQIEGIDNLSSVIFSSVTLKLCAKLSPLLAAKFLMHYNTDALMFNFLKGISDKIKFKASFIGKSFLFIKTHTRKITYGFMGLTLGSLLGYHQFKSSNIVAPNTLIIPLVRHIVYNMNVITANSKLLVYTCSKNSGELVDAFYRGFREETQRRF